MTAKVNRKVLGHEYDKTHIAQIVRGSHNMLGSGFSLKRVSVVLHHAGGRLN